MTKTLREEIYDELGNLAEFGEQNSVTDKILKLFEKLIDEQMDFYEKKLTGYAPNILFTKNETLQELKKELEK